MTAEEAIRDRRQADLAFAVTLLLVLLATALLYSWFPTITVILLISGFLAYLLLPLVDRLHRKMPRTAAVLVVALGLVGLFTIVAVMIAPAVVHEIGMVPETVANVSRTLGELWQQIHAVLPGPLARMTDSLLAAANRALSAGPGNPSAVSGWATAAASGVTAVASAVIFVPVFVFLMLRGFHATVDRWNRAVPPRWHAQFNKRFAEVDRVLSGFIRGQMLVATILAVLYSAAFTFIGIPAGLVIGLLAGLGELAPFLGGVIAVTLGSLMALGGGRPADVLWVVLSALAIHGLEASVINPFIVGTKAKVGPAVVIVALAIGAELFGFVGLLVAVPVAALLRVGLMAAFDAYRLTPFFRRRATV